MTQSAHCCRAGQIAVWVKKSLRLKTAGLRFLEVQPQLPKFGGFAVVDARLQVGFFHKISPTRAPVFLALAPFIIVESFLRAFPAIDHGHNAARDVRLLVEADDRKRMLRVVSHILIFAIGEWDRQLFTRMRAPAILSSHVALV